MQADAQGGGAQEVVSFAVASRKKTMAYRPMPVHNVLNVSKARQHCLAVIFITKAPPPQHTHILLTAIFSFCLLSVIRLQLDPFSSDCAEIFRSAYVHASSCCPEKICLDLLSPT